MIVNENGWGDKKAPVAKEEVIKDIRKAILQKDTTQKVGTKNAEQK